MTTTTTTKTNVIGDTKAKLMARIEAFCSEPRSYLAIVKHGRVSDSQTRYVLRQLMNAGRMLKSGARENTVYVHFRPLPAAKKAAKKAKAA
jgi:hypothetical protein